MTKIAISVTYSKLCEKSWSKRYLKVFLKGRALKVSPANFDVFQMLIHVLTLHETASEVDIYNANIEFIQ